MPQIAFFVAGASAPAGGFALLLAWDRRDRGASAADDIDAPFDGEVGLYTLLVPTVGAQLVRAKSRSPISIPEDGCPNNPVGFPDKNLLARFSLKPGGTGLSLFPDLSFDLFDGSSRVYGAAPDGSTLKAELAAGSVIAAEVSFQDQLQDQPWEDPLEGLATLINIADPTKEIWRTLMTPDQPLTF